MPLTVRCGGARCNLQLGMVGQDTTYNWVMGMVRHQDKMPLSVGYGGARCHIQYVMVGQDATQLGMVGQEDTFIDLLRFSVKQEGSKLRIYT